MAKRMLRILLIAGAAYLLGLLALYLAQRRLVYLPTALSPDEIWNPGFPAEIVTFPSADGVKISGLFAEPPDAEGPVMLIFHGNAGNIRSWATQLGLYQSRGFGGLLVDPRGYGLSEGSPSEEGCIADGEAALAWLEARGIGPGRVVVHGISIGTGVAVPVAARHPLRGLILESPFTTLPAVAQRVFFFVPCGLLLKDQYDNLKHASSIASPALVIHGSRDRTIPIGIGRELAEALPDLRTMAVAEGYGHNGLSSWPRYWPHVEEFLRSLR